MAKVADAEVEWDYCFYVRLRQYINLLGNIGLEIEVNGECTTVDSSLITGQWIYDLSFCGGKRWIVL